MSRAIWLYDSYMDHYRKDFGEYTGTVQGCNWKLHPRGSYLTVACGRCLSQEGAKRAVAREARSRRDLKSRDKEKFDRFVAALDEYAESIRATMQPGSGNEEIKDECSRRARILALYAEALR